MHAKTCVMEMLPFRQENRYNKSIWKNDINRFRKDSRMRNSYYIASCVFTARFPELSFKIQQYVASRFPISTVRCCFPKYKLKEYEEKMPKGVIQDTWKGLPDSADVQPGDTVYYLCHNCANIVEEMHPGVHVKSLWELILEDESFQYRDYSGLKATIQDCWRAKERKEEQDAVRNILKKMNVAYVEAAQNHESTNFCGSSLYRPQPPRNINVAPKHYRDGAEGLFLPHTEAEQVALMKTYCDRLETDTVICYCHYCLEGLQQGGKDGRHILELLFPD